MSKVYEGRFGIKKSVKRDGTVVLKIDAKADGEFTAADAPVAYKKLCDKAKELKLPVDGVFVPAAKPGQNPKAKRSPVVLHKYGRPYFAMLPDDGKPESTRLKAEWL